MSGFEKNNSRTPFWNNPLTPARLVFSNSGNSKGGGGPENDNNMPEEAPDIQDNIESKEKEQSAPTSPQMGDSIEYVTSTMSENINAVIGSADEALKVAKEQKKQEVIKTIESIQQELRNLRGVIDESQKKLRAEINRLLDQKILTQKQAKEILDLGITLPDFEQKLNDLTNPLKGKIADQDLESLITEKKKEAAQFPKIKEEFEQITVRLNEAMQESRDRIYEKAHKQKMLESLGRQLGFELKKGTKLRFRTKRAILRPSTDPTSATLYEQVKDENGLHRYEPIYRKATIKEINFQNFKVKEGDRPEQIFAALTPYIVLDIEDETPDQNGIKNKDTIQVTGESLKKIVDMQDMTVDYPEGKTAEEDLKTLGSLLGVEIKPGAVFNYRDISFDGIGKVQGADKSVTIKKITREEDEFFNTHESNKKGKEDTFIELDHEVVVAHSPRQIKKSKLRLDEFIKWFTRLGVVALTALTISELRNKLKEENELRNGTYQRNPKEYPPIELKKDEILGYDTIPPKLFRIKDISDDKIELDNGSVYTPASFLNWVKNNEVEKFDPEAEAEKRVAFMPEETEEEKEQKEREREKAKSAAEDKKQKRQSVPPGYSTENSEKDPPPNISYLRKLYNETYFLSLGSMYEMGKQIFEYIKRYMDRSEKERIGIVGNQALSFIPGLGREFEVIRQKAENEQVNYYKEAFDQYGYTDFMSRLSSTTNRDELKALLTVMSEKGFINWQDKTLWAAIKRVAAKFNFDLSHAEHNEDSIGKILDEFWGKDSFRDFRNKNDSAYQNRVNENKQWAMRLENDPEQKNGMKGRLQSMLFMHINGKWVDPAIYEALLYFAIENGKLSFAEKIYFLVMGLGMEGKGGDTDAKPLLDWYRLSQIEGNLLNRFPVLDYFTDWNIPKVDSKGVPIYDQKTGKQKVGQPHINEMKQIIRDIMEKDSGKSIYRASKPDELTPGRALQEYIESEMMLNPNVVSRMADKASRDVENWDHDDFHMFGSQLRENQIEQVALRSGAKQQASSMAVKNTLAGLNHFTRRYLDQYIEAGQQGDSDAAQKNLRRFMDTLRSYIRLDAIVQDHFKHNMHEYTKFDTEMRSYALVDPTRMIAEMSQEMHKFITLFLEKSKDHLPLKTHQDLLQTWDIMRQKFGPSQQAKQKMQTEAYLNFGTKMEKAISTLQSRVGNEGVAQIFDEIQNETPGNNTKLIKGIQSAPKSKIEMEAMKDSQDRSYALAKEEEINLNELALEYRRLVSRVKAERDKSADDKRKEKEQKLNSILSKIDQSQHDKVSIAEEKTLKSEIDTMRKQLGMDPEFVDSPLKEAA